ncbi:hypothetical protein NHX12_023436 [Muraenolepis orangiensis]|uniref:Uncharacterized protein n=1 Tax=Muraenolepis orangiensis TaxID=630683 RepID=A0A9Q0IST1_9TELE|nr:hypothetical protein NHX12_023436 [Muraenolepis orangiensis]
MEKDFQSAPKRFWQTIRRFRRGKRGSIQAVYSKGDDNVREDEEDNADEDGDDGSDEGDDNKYDENDMRH